MPLTTLYGDGTRVVGNLSMGFFPQPIHPDVLNYVARQNANGYSPSRARVDALNNLVYTLIGNGIYANCQAIYPFLGGTTANAQKWNLKNSDDTNAAFRLLFTGSWTFAETGVKTNTASIANYARTYYVPSSNATNNSGHLGVYIRNSYAAAGCVIGGSNGSLVTSTAFQLFASVSASITTIQGQNTNQSSSFGTSSAGMYLGNRSSSTAQQAYYNGLLRSSSNSFTSASLATATSELTISARNNGALSMEHPTNSEFAMISIGQSLSEIQVKAYYVAVQAYQTSLGRQI